MNKEKIKKCLWNRIRLRPKACSIDYYNYIHLFRDDVWIVRNIKCGGIVELQNVSTGHVAKLGPDHIHHFDSDPMSDTDGLSHGFLILNVQIFISGYNVQIEPLAFHNRYSRKYELHRNDVNLQALPSSNFSN